MYARSWAGKKARVGIEPTIEELQSSALTTWLPRRDTHDRTRTGTPKQAGNFKSPSATSYDTWA